MLQKSGKLPRIDLAHHHLQALSLSLITDWDDDFVDMFGWDDEVAQLLGGVAAEGAPLIYSYQRNKITYAILIVGGPSLTNDDDFDIGIRYAVVPPEIPVYPDQGSTEVAFLRLLTRLTPKEPIQVTAEYEFGPVPAADLWFPLPNRTGSPPESPLVEIQGVRGTKLDAAGERTEFEFTLDRAEEDAVMLFLEFRAEPRFDHQTPTQLLEMADTFARVMVRR